MSDYLEELSEKRKKAQAEGLYPEWYTTAGYSLFEQKYRYEASGFKEQAQRIAKTAAKHLGKYAEEYEQKFFDLIWKGWLSCSTPVLSNMGTTRGMPVSCEGAYVEDSVDSFYSVLHEQAVLSKHGFGTSVYLGDVRPRGSKISGGGKSSGVLPVLKNFVQMSRDVSQGSSRRGAIASYLPIEHGDFWEVVEYLEHEPDDLNIGWNISDAFVHRLEEGDEDAIKRFKRVLRVKMVTGRGYFFFPDKVNRKRPEAYVKNSLNVLASNLCSEITLHSSKEYSFTCQPEFASIIKKGVGLTTLKNVEVGDEIWSETGWTKVVNKVSSGVKPVKRFVTTLGVFEGTDDHRVVQNGEKVEARFAKTIDPLASHGNLQTSGFSNSVVLNGLLLGDGTIRNGKPNLCVGQNDHDYFNSDVGELIAKEGYKFFRAVDPSMVFVDIGVPTYERVIPMIEWTDLNTRSFLRGLFSANGSVTESVVLTQTSLAVVKTAQELLSTLGIKSRLYSQGSKKYTFSNGEYTSKRVWRLMVTNPADMRVFEEKVGFLQKYKQDKLLSLLKPRKNKNRRTKNTVKYVEEIGEHEVFHIEVDNKTHTYWTGGLNVSNCVLSSMNLAKWDEWKDTDAVFTATVFLDCVASEFIERSEGINGLQKARNFTINGRALGLGTAGFHTYLQEHMLPFEGFEAHNWNNLVFKHLSEESLKASQWLAKEFGEPEWCRGLGVRNTHRLAVAPTKSSALLMGGISEGINPDPAMTFTQAGAGGEVQRINPPLLALMKKKGVATKKHIQEVIDARGSVQGVGWLTDEEKLVYKTAFEIDMSAVLRLASARAKWLDQWQSLNLFFSAEEDPAYIAKIHREAFLDENILALYYCYSMAGVTAAKGECIACS